MQRSHAIMSGMGLWAFWMTQSVWASSGTMFDGATAGITAFITLVAYLMLGAGLLAVGYASYRMDYHSLPFGMGIGLILAASLVSSWPTLGSWIGLAAGATLHPEPWLAWPIVGP